MAEEVRFFGRLSLYALIVGVIYWLLSHEMAGTVLLLGFGIATGVGFLVLRQGAPRTRGGVDWEADDAIGEGIGVEGASSSFPMTGPADGPFGDESGPVPGRSSAPLVVGFGVAVIALGAAFGLWFVIVGAVPLVIGSLDWLRSANRELDQRMRADARADLAAARTMPAPDGRSDPPAPAS
jgi:hypothetical protein